jgi:hypothetical protein
VKAGEAPIHNDHQVQIASAGDVEALAALGGAIACCGSAAEPQSCSRKQLLLDIRCMATPSWPQGATAPLRPPPKPRIRHHFHPNAAKTTFPKSSGPNRPPLPPSVPHQS